MLRKKITSDQLSIIVSRFFAKQSISIIFFWVASSKSGSQQHTKKTVQKILSFVIFILLNFTLLCHANEKITNFDSQIIVNKDASIDVTETIQIQAEGKRFIHGLVRRLPTSYTDSYGIFRQTQYQIKNILFNNDYSPYQLKRDGNQLSIYIGSKDVYLQPGNYTYSIKYHVNNAVNFLKDNDEIYWNITGNSWDFPIDKTEANINLPEEAVIASSAAYTGVKGARGRDYVINKLANNQLQVTTSKTLDPGEGLTVGVAWQKGIVKQPTWQESIAQQLNQSSYVVIATALILFSYYYLVWYAYGRDLRKRTIVPLFEPPNHLTPEAIRFIMRMSFDIKVFTAAIVNMATLGYLTLKNNKSEFTLSKTTQGNINLPESEKVVAEKLFTSNESIKLSQTNREKIQNANKALKAYLKNAYQRKYFITNTKYLIPGVLLTLVAFATAILTANDDGNTFFISIWVTGWTFVCYFLLYQVFLRVQNARANFSFTTVASAIFMTLFALPFLIGELVGLFVLSTYVPIFIIPILFFILILNFVFYFLLKAPTDEGRKLMDEIDGFKLYLSTTEKYRLNTMNPPEKTPELFEKYLPYAIALNVENEWGKNFEEILRAASIDPEKYQPTWYSGTSPWSGRNISALPAFIGAGISSSLASTSTSSSGSGGGGSSGGGGGGGGGGGW